MNHNYFVYILTNIKKSVIYIGVTNDLHTVPLSVSSLKKGFPTINFIIINNDKYSYERVKRGNRIKIKQKSITKCN